MEINDWGFFFRKWLLYAGLCSLNYDSTQSLDQRGAKICLHKLGTKSWVLMTFLALSPYGHRDVWGAGPAAGLLMSWEVTRGDPSSLLSIRSAGGEPSQTLKQASVKAPPAAPGQDAHACPACSPEQKWNPRTTELSFDYNEKCLWPWFHLTI